MSRVARAVVLQASELRLSTAIVAPTSTHALATSFRPEVEVVGTRTRVLTEQLGSVDRRRPGSAREAEDDVERPVERVQLFPSESSTWFKG